MKLNSLFLIFLFPYFIGGVELSQKDKKTLSDSSSLQSPAFQNFNKKKPRANGIILKFYNWPSAQETNLIITNLEKAGFKKISKIERFKIWFFEGPESTNKIPEIKQLCKQLSSVSSLELCEPNYFTEIAVYNYVPSASDAREMIGKAKSSLEKAEQRVESARQALQSREEKSAGISQSMATDKGLITEKKRLRTAQFALKQAKKELEKAVGNDKIKRARERVKNLEKLVEGRKKRVEDRKKWFQDTKAYVENNQNDLLESKRNELKKAENWLEAAKHALKERVSKYAKYLPPQEAEALYQYVQSLFPNEELMVGGGGSNEDMTQQSGNIRTCNIVSSQFDLQDDKLSDYWAQRMIGADLLKKKLKEATLVNKHLVEIFDRDEINHDIGVRNLISDEGAHSVLPEIGDRAGITHTENNSQVLKEGHKLLTTAEKNCADYKDSSDSSTTPLSSSVNQEGEEHQVGSSSSPQRKTASYQGGSGSNTILHTNSINQEKAPKLQVVAQDITIVDTGVEALE